MDIPITVHQNNKNEDQPNEENEHESKTNEPETQESEHENNQEEHKKSNSSNNKTILTIALVIIVAGAAYFFTRGIPSPQLGSIIKSDTAEDVMSDTAMKMKDTVPEIDAKAILVKADWIANIADIEFKNSGTLSDVSGSTATGSTGTDLIDNVYHLYATFENLPIPEEEFFYEGWIVRKSPLSIMSTGKLVMHEDNYINAYLSRKNLIDYTTYVLTLEPDDGDPAPATHILEGEITLK